MVKKRKYLSLLRYAFSIFLIMTLLLNSSVVFATNGQIFPDVTPDMYFYTAVEKMYKQGAVKGYSNGEFKPKNNITIAESLVVLFRLSGIKVEESIDPKYWYSDVLNLAIELGIVSADVNPNDLATRLDISKYIISLYKIDMTQTKVNNVFYDTNLLVANTMYQYGIFSGYQDTIETGEKVLIFAPYNNITRGELCQVLYRLNEKILSPYLNTLTFGDYTVSANPSTKEDFYLLFKYLGETGELQLRIPYTHGLNDVSSYIKIRDNIVSAFENSFSYYPEYFSFTPKLNMKREVNLTGVSYLVITISNENYTDEEILLMREKFYATCESLIEELYEKGILTESMTDIEKISVLYYYVVTHNQYDLEYGVNSFTGYGAAIEGVAVCQGYTAMFNYLCRLLDMEVMGVSGIVNGYTDYHMWSRIKDEATGIWYHYDTTFADPIPNRDGFCDFSYFHLSPEDIFVDRIEIEV